MPKPFKFSKSFIAALRAAEMVKCMRKYMDGISQNLQRLSPY